MYTNLGKHIVKLNTHTRRHFRFLAHSGVRARQYFENAADFSQPSRPISVDGIALTLIDPRITSLTFAAFPTAPTGLLNTATRRCSGRKKNKKVIIFQFPFCGFWSILMVFPIRKLAVESCIIVKRLRVCFTYLESIRQLMDGRGRRSS